MQRMIYFFLIFSLGIFRNCFSNQDETLHTLRDNWHQFLPNALRLYPAHDSVINYPLNSKIYVYEPTTIKRTILWITGNAFIFNEPESHHPFLRYVAETTESRIYALSHGKIPEFSYADIQNDLMSSFRYLVETKMLDDLPLVVAGDSSGALLTIQLLPHFLEKRAIDQLLLIAPGLDMSVFLNEDTIAVESFPLEAQNEVLNQKQLMTFISSLLFQPGQRIDSAKEVLYQLQGKFPKIHMICFEYDIFYPQALELKSAYNEITIDCRKEGFHVDYLLKTPHEDPDQPFLLNWKNKLSN